MKCPACGREYRAKGHRALLIEQPLDAKGVGEGTTFERKRVCGRCARRALIVVPKAPPSPPTELTDHGAFYEQVLVVQRRTLNRILADLRPLAKMADAQSRGRLSTTSGDALLIAQGRAEGFEGAIERIKRELEAR